MPEAVKYAYDAAPAITVGQREQQEDAVAIDFADGADIGFIVLADGMGGHLAGDIASKIVVTEIFSELKMLADDPADMERNIGAILNRAVVEANKSVGHVAAEQPQMHGMGSTLVAPVIFGNRLYWISIGDSPLYLFRGSRLFRLNEEHSLASRMDKLVARGEMAREEAEQHPDRSCLTSVLIGRNIPEIDCRDTPIELRDNDILIAASDGLQFIGEQEIARVVFETRNRPSADIGARLLQSIVDLDDPEQDNVSLCVLKVTDRSSSTGDVFLPEGYDCRDADAQRRQER
jgi:serine/threonine protein phosphatase PrpC